MPVYEYLCKACEHEFEREQRISDSPVKKCPACGARKAKRLISRTSFLLKGGGWYSDLYASSKPARADKGHTPDGGSEGKVSAPESGGKAASDEGSGKSETAGPAAGSSKSKGKAAA
jgi:putative FmdB family regulatory protein